MHEFTPAISPILKIRHLAGLSDYQFVLKQMQDFTSQRDNKTLDELWVLEHLPVYTLGQAGKMTHLINPNTIPLVQSDRGGQITYHGPGQLIFYFLLDLKRQGWSTRNFVSGLEQLVIDTLKSFHINSHRQDQAPGVYVDGAKIASIGLRLRKGCSYHGISVNVDMDLSPFQDINPCGYQGLKVTQLSALYSLIPETQSLKATFSNRLTENLCQQYHYSPSTIP